MDTKSNEEKIKDNINALINHLRKNADENIREQVLSFARKVFGGAPGKPINDSPAEIKEKVTTRVAQLCDQRSVLSSQDLTQRFLSNNTAYRKQ